MKKYSGYFLMALSIFAMFMNACTKQDANAVEQKIQQAQPAVREKPLTTQRDLRNAIIDVARTTIPAVVHIEVTQSQEINSPFSRMSPSEDETFSHRFFGFPENSRKFKREMKGIGTGMIINKDGYILTNNHVVSGANDIQVVLSNETEYKAKVIGTDSKTDLAVIKISASEQLPSVVFGDSDKVDVGEWVVAIGHPRGLDQTVTQGIISAKHRQGITNPSTYQDFLQTDAAINPGNSGGPLLNLDGQVIGVNSIIASQSGGFEGIGFAIPSNMAIYIAKSLMATGKVERGWLGITLQNIPFEKMKTLKLSSPKGAYVVNVAKGSPAYKAGIKPGDVILSIDGTAIGDSGELRNRIGGTQIGKEISLSVIRNGKKLTIPVKIGEPGEAAKIMASSLRDKLGVDVRPVTEDEAAKYDLEQIEGVVITRIDPVGPLARVGFEVDDIILDVNDRPIESIEEFAAIVNELKPGQKVTLFAVDHRTGRTGNIRVQGR